ncbi:Fungal Zn(2)-Cys(6) binuclear cluster domain-containing protein [Penicillium ucsense]|uniref:Fungal Zn(2)-Cys(6) binuclear cluster domain-containing protein n=1 Tax=Penicillium ucsense TaxID=2839758 RepID=A0A8J8VY30_9EURO|nr:Fungal Zn(2)-Cys(6) binuclear cluster domain-containing protein [Penicillium ucsense]KAF7734399.1 Fungal Zn(2)-Cys(6) binuclear cluster domain-containing protein [Penicillium ucsense]
MSARRRNGKPASCEPCRHDKVRCDHALPVCSRCQARGISSRCLYHPAPMTRAKTRRAYPVTEDGPPERAFRATSSTPAQEPEKVLTTPLSINYTQTPVTENRAKPILAGYFGPTSFVAPLTDDVDLLAAEQGECEEEYTQRVLPVYWTEKVTEIVSSLGDFSLIGSLLHEYFDLCQSASLPAPLILNTIGPLTALCTERAHLEASENGASSLTARIIQNTIQPFKVPPETVAKTFHHLFTGPAIRLEIIGVICSVAGRASKMGLASDKSKSRSSTVSLARTFIAASDTALQICKMLTPLNDLSIWLAHENLLLTDNLNWSSSPRCWNRLGELATDIFALGIHRESRKDDKVPQFLMETRRRVFAAAYQLDKSVATFLGRPTRIPLRYSDCSMPLDLPDDAFVSDQAQLEYRSRDLDSDNWNVRGVYQRASWLRVRYIISTFREEILEVSLQNVTPHVVNVLNDISRRSRLAWEALPAHLQHTPQCWDTDHPLAARIMLSVSYLAHLYNDLLIQRLLAGRENPRGSPALLAVSSEILSSILAMDSQREQMAGLIRRDLMWTILLYGFPSASLLIKALQHQKRTGEPLLYEGSRSALIRQLSVFVFHLETLARPNIPNYALFQRAAKIFSEIIDEVLEPHDSYPGIGGDVHDASFLEFDQILSADGLDLLNSLDCGVAYNQWLF